MTNPDVIVIGGGLAGIAAALTASETGAQVMLVEQRPHLGGAASSFRRGSLELDYGQHVFLRCCSAYRSFVKRIGGEGHLFLQARLEVPVFDGTPEPAWIRRNSLPPPLHLARAVAGYHHLSAKERMAIIPAARALKRLDPGDQGLDDVTFASWLERSGQTDRAIEAFWDLIALPTLNLPSSQASLLAAARTFQIGVLTEAAAADIGWATVPLSRLHHELAGRALAAAGVEVRLRSKAEAVEAGDERRPGLVLRDGSRVEATAVVAAVPPQALGRLFAESGGPLSALGAGLETSPIVNVHLWFDRRVMPYRLAAGVGASPLWVFDRTAAAGVEHGQYLVVSVSAADCHTGSSAQSIAATTVRALARFLPLVGQAELISWLTIKDPSATIRVRPGSAKLRSLGSGGPPGVFVAGAWTETGWPPTMESAVRSGIAAAQAALNLNVEQERS